MILNPTHEITLSGLPSEILDAYVRYKKGSRAIVTWLVQYGSKGYKGARTLPIKELAALARKVSSSITQIPDVIHFHFKETIAARRCLSRFFRSNVDLSDEELDTVNHEHFTNSLHDIYVDLCEQCRLEEARRNKPKTGHRKSTSLELTHNHYTCLPVEDVCNLADMNLSHDLSLDCHQCNTVNQPACFEQSEDLEIEGDEMGTAFKVIMLIEKAQNVLGLIADCWTKAGRDEVSFVAATSATSAALVSLREIEMQLKEFIPNDTLSKLHHYSSLFDQSSAGGGPKDCGRCDVINDLRNTQRFIKRYVESHQPHAILSCPLCIQKPANYIQAVSHGDRNLQAVLLENMLHLVYQTGGTPSLVFKSTPCFAEIGCLMSQMQNDDRLMQCTWAMCLLTRSYKSYLQALPIPSAISLCRISALKLATRGASAIDKILSDKQSFPCQCPQTLAYHLSNLQHDLEMYSKQKRWDVYFQSPWVAGSHMMEMYDMLSYYGMRLFHYRHYVAAILHTYNLLQQVAGLENLAVFEELCHLFREILFPGGSRPTLAFKNSWSRYVGARLRFKKGNKGHDHRETWCMAIPAHEARSAAGLSSDMARDRFDPKFDYGRIDQCLKIKQNGYRLDATLLAWSNESKDSRPSTSSSSISASSSPTPPSSPFSPTRKSSNDLTTILSQFHHSISSPQAPPHLNLLHLFTLSVTLITEISAVLHKPSPSSSTDSSTQDPPAPCICFTTTLLAAGDRIVTGRRLGRLEAWSKDERKVVDIICEVFRRHVKDEEGGLLRGESVSGREEWIWF